MQLITVKELSKILNVKEATIYSWAYNGTVPSYKLNGLLRFDLEEIKEWVKNSRPVSENLPEMPRTPRKPQDINALVKNTIARVNGKPYNQASGKPDRSQGLGKEV